MTALLCCRILSTSLSGDTRGTLSCAGWGAGGLGVFSAGGNVGRN